MSTLAEIEQAITRLPESQVQQLTAWLQKRNHPQASSPRPTHEPDFVQRARHIWGDRPPGETLSALLSRSRD